MLKIALVTPYDLASPGGVTAHIRSQARALRALGHEVLIYGPSSSADALEDGETALQRAITITVGGTASGLALNPFLGGRVKSILREERFDVIHTHEPLAPFVPWPFLRHAGPAVRVGTFHVHRAGAHWPYGLGSIYLRRLVNRLDHRIAVSEAARKTVARYFPGAYEIIPNGVDVERFQQERPRPPELNDGRRNVLFISRIEPRKGLPHLIRAMARIRATVPSARLVVVGDGPDRDQAEALARDLPEDVLFVGRAADDDLAGYVQAADVFCAPATGGESFGIILLEAMAAGKAIVASDIEGYAAVLGSSQAGLLVPPGDSDSLADAVIRVLQDDALRGALGERGRAASAAYDWAGIARHLEALYRSLAERDPADLRSSRWRRLLSGLRYAR